MPLDPALVGHRFAPCWVDLDEHRVRAFSLAIGEERPQCFDLQAAQALGLPGLLCPPTLLILPEILAVDFGAMIELFGLGLNDLLHGEQSFAQHQPLYSGQRLRVEKEVKEITSKKGGLLEFIRLESRFYDPQSQLLAQSSTLLVVNHQEKA